MKKRAVCLFFCLVLALTLLPLPALADGSYTFEQGQSYNEFIRSVHPVDFTGLYGQSAPAGMSFVATADGIFLTGTPTEPGTGSYFVRFREKTIQTLNFSITVSPAPTEAPPATEAPASESPATEAPASETPANKPVITKSPTAETVPVGGSCSFTANATEYLWCAWRFIRDDTTVIFDVVGDRFPGLKINGGNSLTLELSDIPVELDGWDVACIFGNAAGDMTLSDLARITVTGGTTPEPSATPEATATPEPSATPQPTPEVTPEPEHEHAFSGGWKMDNENHWKECSCGEHGEEAEHSFLWNTVKEPTKKEEGVELGTCSVCAFVTTRTLPATAEDGGRGSAGLVIGISLAVAAAAAVTVVLVLRKNRRY